MQSIVVDVSLRLTVAGSTRTDTVVLLRLDSGELERKFILDAMRVRYGMASAFVHEQHDHAPRRCRNPGEAAMQIIYCITCRLTKILKIHHLRVTQISTLLSRST